MLITIHHERICFTGGDTENVHFGGNYTFCVDKLWIEGFQPSMPDLRLQRLPTHMLVMRLGRRRTQNRVLQIRRTDIKSLDIGAVKVSDFALVWVKRLGNVVLGF